LHEQLHIHLSRTQNNIKSSRLAVSFHGISRLGSAFFVLQCFPLAHICIHLTSLHKGNGSETKRCVLLLAIDFYFQKIAEVIKPIIFVDNNF